MLKVLYLALSLLFGYLFGCLTFGYLIGKIFYHTDVRTLGSGSAGTTNVLRNFGKVPAACTFIGDFVKAILPVLLVRFVFAPTDQWYLYCLYCGIGVVLGHNYPFYLKFKGGKGIVVTAGVTLAAAHPIFIPVGLVIFIVAVAATRYVSVGSLLVAWYIPANTIIFYRGDSAFVHLLTLSLLFAFFAYFQHRQNIVRLIHGTENKLWKTKKEKEREASLDNE